jgi:sugar phosphate isomerase/epimerase
MQSTDGMKSCYMSSVCPQHSLPELLQTAKRFGYEGIELRVEWQHGHGVELTATAQQLTTAKRAIQESGIALASIATGCRFQSEDASRNAAELEKARRYVELSATIGAPVVRVFGDPVPTEAVALDEALQRQADAIHFLDALAGQHGVVLGLETHGNLLASQAAEVIARAEARHCLILWHAEHHIRNGESLDRAWVFVKSRVCHVHWRGNAGDVPETEVGRSFRLLQQAGYDGFVSLEDIKPPDSDATLESHAGKFRQWTGGFERVAQRAQGGSQVDTGLDGQKKGDRNNPTGEG